MRQLKARELYARMMKVLAETGNGWMTFKDACNLKSNQTADAANVVHLSNLCTEITEVSSKQETAVCNFCLLYTSNCAASLVFPSPPPEESAASAK